MPVPKRKVSKSRRDKRQANKGIKPKAVTACSNCNEPLTPHTACLSCGYYKGKKVLATKLDRATKRSELRKAAAKEEHAHDDHHDHEHEQK